MNNYKITKTEYDKETNSYVIYFDVVMPQELIILDVILYNEPEDKPDDALNIYRQISPVGVSGMFDLDAERDK